MPKHLSAAVFHHCGTPPQRKKKCSFFLMEQKMNVTLAEQIAVGEP